MARYVYTREVSGMESRSVMDGYLESTPEEDPPVLLAASAMAVIAAGGFSAVLLSAA